MPNSNPSLRPIATAISDVVRQLRTPIAHPETRTEKERKMVEFERKKAANILASMQNLLQTLCESMEGEKDFEQFGAGGG